MSTVDPHITAAELKNLGWDSDELQQLARQRARLVSDTVMVLAESHPAWAPLRGESHDSAMQRLDTALATGLGEYLALPAEDGDDDAALVASVAAEQEPAPEAGPDAAGDPDEPVDLAPIDDPDPQPEDVKPEKEDVEPEPDADRIAREERAAWEEREARRERAGARAAKRKEKLAERLTARAAAREDGF